MTIPGHRRGGEGSMERSDFRRTKTEIAHAGQERMTSGGQGHPNNGLRRWYEWNNSPKGMEGVGNDRYDI